MRKIYAILVLGLLSFVPNRLFDSTPQTLPFTQNWTNTGLITANDNWAGVPGIEGYLGQDITTTTGVDPQTLLTVSAVAGDLDVIANQTNPNTNTSGGVGEFEITNPVIALQGSGTADAPYVVINLNTTGLQNVNVAYNLRDIDGSADNAIQPVALQYRVGSSGNFTNVPAGYVADATTGPSLATLVTPVSAQLPAACNNEAQVQVRIVTANAVGSDEWVGIDDINITGSPLSGNNNNSDIITNSLFSFPANVNYLNYQATDITDANSLEVAQFTIRDGGASADADAVATILTNLSMSLSNNANIRRVALYDGTTELGEVAGGATVSFTGLTLTAPDDGSKTFSVRVTFNTAVTDNQQYQFAVTSATADGSGSGFAAANAGGATSSTAGDDNRIEVTADRLAFVQNTTSPTGLNAAMAPAPTVSANDANGNRDLDFTAFIGITSTGTLQGSPVSTQAVAGLSTFSGAIIHTATGTGLQLAAASTGLTSATSNLFDIQTSSSATDYFRSKAPSGGNWGEATSWESSPDNSTWNSSTLVPTAAANTITIRNGHTITVAAAADGDQVVVEAGGTLTLNAAFTLADGTGTDLDVSGTVVNTSGTHVFTGTSAFGANSLYQHNRNGSPVPTATWNVTSTVEITGVTGTQPSGLGQTFGNFTWNCPSQSGNIGLGSPSGFAIAGNLTVTSSGGVTNRAFRFTSNTAYTLAVSGNLVLNGGHLGLTSGTGTMALTVAGNVSISNSSELYLSQGGSALGTLNIGGDLSINNATLTETGSANGIVTFNKNGTQSFSTSSATISNIINYSVVNTSTLLVNSGLPVNTGATLTVDGTLIAAATVTNNGTTNINNIFQLNDGGWGTGTGFVYGPAATLVFNTTTNYGVNNDAYWPSASGPVNVTVQNTGGITMNVTRTVTGLFQTAAGVLNGNNLTLNGTAQLNTGGYFTNAPIYGPASLLRYNTGGQYNRGDEWNATGVGTIGTTNGYPNDVQVSNNTTINFPNGVNVDRACARDLIIDNGSSLYADFGGFSPKLIVGRHFDMSGNVTLGAAIGGDMYVRGNFTRNAGTFNPNGRAVFFDGPSGDQTITGVTTFDYLEVNKAAGNVVLASSISCNQGLTLASGKIVLGANDINLLNGAPSALNAASSSSYVVTNGAGAFRRAINTVFVGQDYFLPVGNIANRQNVTVNFVTISANNTLSARFISGAPAGTAGLPLSESGNNITRAANNGYWEVTAASATTDNYTGTFSANGFTDITDYTRVHLIKRADAVSNWVLNGTHTTTTGSNLAAVLQRTGMSGFSQFAVGGQSNLSLPVTLISFSGYKDGSRNQLSWTTGTEINNRGFEVQRSVDGMNYTSIGFVNSLATGGNSNDLLSYRFTDNTAAGAKQYYRLRQEDFDGRSKLSNIVLINGAKATSVVINVLFPNPANDLVNVLVSVPGRTQLTLLVTDMAGRTLSQKIVSAETGSNTIQLNVGNLSSGTYLVHLVCADGCEVTPAKFIKY